MLGVVVLCAVGLAPIAVGLVFGVFMIVGSFVPFVTAALAYTFEAARHWNLVGPLMLALVVCNCFILNRIGAYFDG